MTLATNLNPTPSRKISVNDVEKRQTNMLHKYLYMCAAEDGALIKTKQGVAMEVGCLEELIKGF